jgi:hypothetical protein
MVMGAICHGDFHSRVEKDIQTLFKVFLKASHLGGIIRTTADYFLLPYVPASVELQCYCFSQSQAEFYKPGRILQDQISTLAVGRGL